MEKRIISRKVSELPQTPIGEATHPYEIWEETDGGAFFKVIKHHILPEANADVLTLSVTGTRMERDRIVSEFTDALGSPALVERAVEREHEADIAIWLV